jgi:hypothetical protein
MTDEERRLLAEIFREDDRWRAEHEDWLARREAEREALARKSGEDGLVYRTTENNAQVAAPVAVSDVSNADGLFGDERDDMLARALGVIIAEMRAEREAERSAEQGERNAELAKLQTEIDELRGKINALLTLMGNAVSKRLARARDDSVIDLPNWRRRHA